MINYSTSRQLNKQNLLKLSGIRDPHQTPLLGKAVLLIGNDTAVLKSLILQLAQKGADIAVLCWQISVESAHWLEEQVKAVGRKLLIVEQAKNQDAPLTELVHRIAAEWGHFDIFIDVSARQSKPAAEFGAQPVGNDGTPRNEHTSDPMPQDHGQEVNWHPEQWHLAQVVLEEMIHH